jgi:hypothetical protein
LTNTCPTLKLISSIANSSKLANGIIAKEFRTKTKMLFHFNPKAIYPSGMKINNTFIHEVRNIILRDITKVDGGGGFKTAELGGDGIEVVLLFVSSFGVEIDDRDFLRNDIFQEKGNNNKKRVSLCEIKIKK